MSLSDKIVQELKQAMKQRQVEKVAALRLLVASFKNAEIEINKQLSEKEEIEVLRREAKKRQESIEAYKQAGRQDLVDQEQAELKIIQGYLPQQMSREEIKKLVEDLEGFEAVKGNFGEAMKLVMSKVAGKADGKIVAEVVRELV